jgi:hypothetical protein
MPAAGRELQLHIVDESDDDQLGGSSNRGATDGINREVNNQFVGAGMHVEHAADGKGGVVTVIKRD